MAEVKSPAADITPGKAEYIWKGPIYDKTAVPVWYYVILVVISLALSVAFYFAKQPLSIVVIAAALLFFLTHANEVPKAHRYTVNDKGVTIEAVLYGFQDLKNFWISDTGKVVTLYLEQAGRISIPLSIPIRLADVDGIRALLRNHLPESRRQSDLLIDILARMTGII